MFLSFRKAQDAKGDRRFAWR